MITKANRLREELSTLRRRLQLSQASGAYSTVDEQRIIQVQRELTMLAKRRAYTKAHREMLFDLNGHHGPA